MLFEIIQKEIQKIPYQERQEVKDYVQNHPPHYPFCE